MSLSQTRICVEKVLPHHHKELENIKRKSGSALHFQKLQAAFWTKKLWPANTTITIGFLGSGDRVRRTPWDQISEKAKQNNLSIDPLQEEIGKMKIPEAIEKIVSERLSPIVNLNLKFVKDVNNAIVRISFDPNGGAWSLVGTDCLGKKSGATMNLGWFDVATTIHEFCHTLGMIHEHQNPRGNYIDWDVPKVLQWASETQGWDKQTTTRNIIDAYEISQINGSKYDPMSIMLYFFPASITKNNKGTHQNLRMSAYDVTYLNKMYPGSRETPEQFYKRVYNQSLDSSKKESKTGRVQTIPKVFWAVMVIIVISSVIIMFSK